MPPWTFPSLPKKAKGTKALDGRDKTHVTRAEVLAILDRLPERSRAGHPVKAFATLAAELGIRRETMDKLAVPKHYEPGTDQTCEAWAAILSQDSWQTRRDSNPRPLPPEGSALSS